MAAYGGRFCSYNTIMRCARRKRTRIRVIVVCTAVLVMISASLFSFNRCAESIANSAVSGAVYAAAAQAAESAAESYATAGGGWRTDIFGRGAGRYGRGKQRRKGCGREFWRAAAKFVAAKIICAVDGVFRPIGSGGRGERAPRCALFRQRRGVPGYSKFRRATHLHVVYTAHSRCALFLCAYGRRHYILSYHTARTDDAVKCCIFCLNLFKLAYF